MFSNMLSGETMEPVDGQNDAPRKRGPVVLALFVMVAAIAALLSVSDHPTHKSMASVSATGLSVPPRIATPASTWTYASNTLELTGEKQDVACTTSQEGAQLCFRKTGAKLESYLAFPQDDKQFLCTKYHCTTQIKVDDQPVFNNVGSESPDGNIGLIYLAQPQQLLSMLQNARQVALGPPMYEQDGLILHFNVTGLSGFSGADAGPSAEPGSRVTEGHDPRLTAPLSPVLPPESAPQGPPPAIFRVGVA